MDLNFDWETPVPHVRLYSAMLPSKQPPLLTEREAGWNREPVRPFRRRENASYSARIRTTTARLEAPRLVTMPTAITRFLCKWPCVVKKANNQLLIIRLLTRILQTT